MASYPQRPFSVPAGGKELVLVRHGASEAAVAGEPFELLEGHADPALAPEGSKQAAAVGARLAPEPLAALFRTPLRRTGETFAPLAAATGLEPSVIADLREVHLGEWEGGELRVRAANRDPVFLQALAEQRWDVIPGAESMDSLAERVAAGLDAAFATLEPGSAGAACVHGGVIGEICRQVTGSEAFAFIHADNGSISRVVQMPTGHRLLRCFNDTSHLAD